MDKKDTYATGEISLAIDPSLYDIADALTYRYMQAYPEAKIKLQQVKEKEALKDLLNRKVSSIIMSRDLTAEEKSIYQQKIDKDFQPAYFAADALVFIVPKNSPLEQISVDEIKNFLTDGKRKLIFDGANTSNTDYIAERLKLDQGKIEYSSLQSNENIIEELNHYPHHIGVISLNSISRPFGEKAKALRSKIKILAVSNGQGSYLPEKPYLKSRQYPFTRLLYFLTNENYFGVAKGLIRYSCTDIGQKIVDKNGLQPYNLYKREVQIK
ncbi:PstS family phosphate ABC transporter substrate-binding protein [Elizabethkingia argenteiflava]|nr:substrate-binding domain-containing protein [Elizabethkingia argenteiflava]